MLKAKLKTISIAYERRGQGTPLVLLHGYPLDHSIWNQLADRLENKFDLILPDLRGFGESGIGKMDHTVIDMAADIAGLLDSLGIRNAVVTGHSMGGYVALAFARTYPSRVLGLGLIASQGQGDSPERKTGRYQEAKDILAQGVKGVAEVMSGKLTSKPKLSSQLKDLILSQRPEGLAGALRAMADRPDSMTLLPGFDFPVTIVHGVEDALIPIARAREVRAVVKKGHLVVVEGAGHMLMMEKPQIAADALKGLS